MTSPLACLAERHTARSVSFAGEFISLTEIARETGIDMGQLSRIFSGKSKPSIDTARQIAHALQMDLDSFVTSLDSIQ